MTLLMKPEPFSQEFDRLFNTLFENHGPAGPALGLRPWT